MNQLYIYIYLPFFFLRFFSHIVVIVQTLSHVQLFVTQWAAIFQASPSLFKFMSVESMMLTNHLILCHPLLLFPSIFPSIRVFSNELTLSSGGQSIGASATALVLPMNIQHWFPLGLTVWSCCPRDSQEFKSISSLAFNLLYGLTLTSIHDYWKNLSFDYTDLCWPLQNIEFPVLSAGSY